MINAKDKFREGWVMLTRPFDFTELKRPLQKLTIVYAYAEKPKIYNRISAKGQEKIKEYENRNKIFYLSIDYEDNIYDEIIKDYKEEIYEGEIVQCMIDNSLRRFYPDEYNIISEETFKEVLLDGVAYTLCPQTRSAFDLVKDQIYYSQSRGISKDMAQRFASFNLKDNIMLRPTIHLLEEFCRKPSTDKLNYLSKEKRTTVEILYGDKSEFKYRDKEWLHFHQGRLVWYYGFEDMPPKLARIEFDNNKYWLPHCGYVNAETVKIYEV